MELKHGRHCLAWLCEYDAMSMSNLTSINTILSGDMF